METITGIIIIIMVVASHLVAYWIGKKQKGIELDLDAHKAYLEALKRQDKEHERLEAKYAALKGRLVEGKGNHFGWVPLSDAVGVHETPDLQAVGTPVASPISPHSLPKDGE